MKRYGWVPDIPDGRDHLHMTMEGLAVPTAIDLRPHCPPVYDQGDLGSCTANAIAGALEYMQIQQSDPFRFTPSRLFIYYNERVMEHTVSEDAGAAIRDGIKSVNAIGAPPESEWPYDVTKYADKPSDEAYKEARLGRSLAYKRVIHTLMQMKATLASGIPIVLGISVYESFESDEVASTGILNLPQRGEQMLGGHAVLAVGYEDVTQRFIIRNSWGSDWGQGGYFTIPYMYLAAPSLCDDLWVIQKVA